MSKTRYFVSEGWQGQRDNCNKEFMCLRSNKTFQFIISSVVSVEYISHQDCGRTNIFIISSIVFVDYIRIVVEPIFIIGSIVFV